MVVFGISMRIPELLLKSVEEVRLEHVSAQGNKLSSCSMNSGVAGIGRRRLLIPIVWM